MAMKEIRHLRKRHIKEQVRPSEKTPGVIGDLTIKHRYVLAKFVSGETTRRHLKRIARRGGGYLKNPRYMVYKCIKQDSYDISLHLITWWFDFKSKFRCTVVLASFFRFHSLWKWKLGRAGKRDSELLAKFQWFNIRHQTEHRVITVNIYC